MRRLLASLLLCLSPLAMAQPVEMQDAPLRDFVRWYSDQTGQAVAIPADVSGSLTVYAQDVTPDALPDFFEGVLRSNGYQLVPGNPSTVVPLVQQNFLTRIDTPDQGEPLVTRLIGFDNVRASDIAPLVQSYLSSQPGDARAVPPEVLAASNALLVRGQAAAIEELEALVPRIDVSAPQLVINAVIFETTVGDTFDLGVALGRGRGGASVAGGVNTNNLGTSLSVPGGSFGIFDGNVLALAVQALQRDTNAKVLSTPQILTRSGHRGRISVGQNVPFVTGRVTGQAASVDNPFQTIERRDVGVSLDVVPVATPSGLIVMDVQTQADSLSDSIEASDIITNQRSIQTTVQIRSGQTLLLGGLVSDNTSGSPSAGPGLSPLPVVGGLFTYRSTSHDRRRLYVLLQATVLPGVGGAS